MKINVATTHRFRKAYRSFNAKEQKKIDDGINSFLIEPTNPSSNFEPLNFIDHKLKSIRVTDNIRIILALMDSVYFLLHVDHHDKAYAWGENKRIDQNMITGAIQIYTDAIEIIEGKVEETQKPTKTLFGFCTPEQMLVMGVPEGWVNKLLSIGTEDEYADLWEYLPEDTIKNLNSLLEGFDVKTLVAQIQNEYKEEKPSVMEQVQKQKGFQLLTEDESLKEALSKDISVFRFYLHPTQQIMVDKDFNGPVKLTGTAGTGKTVVALHKTKKLVEALPDGAKPVFFTTYTKYLVKNICSLFDEINIDENKLVVTNLHQFAVNFAKELEIVPKRIGVSYDKYKRKDLWEKYCKAYFIKDFSPEFLMEEYEQVIQEMHITGKEAYLEVSRTGRGEQLAKSKREEVWKALENFENYQLTYNYYTFEDIIFRLNKYLEQWPDEKPFSHVICDEIQDFSNLELRLLRNLVPEGKNDLFLSGDPFQNIYRKRINFSQSNIQIVGRSYRLRTNYRTTDEIQSLAFSALANQQFTDFSGNEAKLAKCESLVYGQEPQYRLFDSKEEEAEFLANYIRENFGQIGLHEICFATRHKNDLQALMADFQNLHFPCISLSEVEDLKDTKGKIVFSTLHGVKGLEFKNIVIFNLSEQSMQKKSSSYNLLSEQEQKMYLKSEHALLYVAFSRATSNLLITGVGDRLSWLEE